MTVILIGDDADRRQATAVAMPRPLTDISRLRAVATLLSGPDPLDDIGLTLLAANLARTAGARTVLVSLMLDNATVTIAGSGVPEVIAEAGGMPVDWTPCGVVAGSDHAVVIGDLDDDPVYSDTPLARVCDLRAYAGVPLHHTDGLVVGTLAVLDPRPYAFGPWTLPRLTATAGRFMTTLTSRRLPERV